MMNTTRAVLLGFVLGLGLVLAGCHSSSETAAKAHTSPAAEEFQDVGSKPVVLPFSETTSAEPAPRPEQVYPTFSVSEASCSLPELSSDSWSIEGAASDLREGALEGFSSLSRLWSSPVLLWFLLGLGFLSFAGGLCYWLLGRTEKTEPKTAPCKRLSRPSKTATPAPAARVGK